MTDLDKTTNIYADLAQGSYTKRDKNFPYEELSPSDRRLIDKGKPVEYNFQNAKDAHGNDASTVYLQPDNTVEDIVESTYFGQAEGGGAYYKSSYKKGLLTDEKAGYNSYFLTDTPKLDESTEHAYFATRGSDGISLNSKNDWIDNNSKFTLDNAYIPQAQLATEAMNKKMHEMSVKAPNATMSFTGHSLGTMVTIQGVANLNPEMISKVDKVMLFNGPDARESINKMPKWAQENIRLLEEQGKIHYYVNPYDIVSMLNRNKLGVDEIGKVHYLLPKSITHTFTKDDQDKYGSSHDFGQYQLNPDGTPKEANLKEHPYIFNAGIKISNLIEKYLPKIQKALPGVKLTAETLPYMIPWLLSSGLAVVGLFMIEYYGILVEAQEASLWQTKIAKLQDCISNASGSKKIELRGELADAVSDAAKTIGEEYYSIFKTEQDEFENEITIVSGDIVNGARSMRCYLSSSEVEGMVAPYQKNSLWNAFEAEANSTFSKSYKEKLLYFSAELSKVAKNIKDYDNGKGTDLFTTLIG